MNISFTGVAAYDGTTWDGAELLCEEKYGGLFRGVGPAGKYFPAYGSAISAWVIVLCGLHMLFFWVHDSTFLKLIAAMFFVNGWSSFGYHAFEDEMCGSIDKLSMLCAVWLVAGFCLDELFESWLSTGDAIASIGSNPVLRRLVLVMPAFPTGPRSDDGADRRPGWSVATPPARQVARGLRSLLAGVGWALSTSVLWFAMAKEIAFPDQNVFILLFALPLIASLAVALLLQRRARMGLVTNSFLSAELEAYGRRRFILGVCLMIVGVICWVGTEQACDSVAFFRWFPGHAVWHVTMAFGMLNALIFAALLRANNFGSTPVFRVDGPSRLANCYFSALPAFAFRPSFDPTNLPLASQRPHADEPRADRGASLRLTKNGPLPTESADVECGRPSPSTEQCIDPLPPRQSAQAQLPSTSFRL